MDFNKDYYKILGIDKNSNADQIKSAFRKKAKEHHPDGKTGVDDKMIKEINEANTVLGEDVSKRQYDQQSKFGSNYNPQVNPFSFFGNFGNFADEAFGGPAGAWFMNNDIFSTIFNKKDEFRETLDINYHTDVTFKDVYNNYDIIVRFKRYVKCTECDWTGFDLHGTSCGCDACDSRGHINGRTCEYCRGTGQIFTGVCEKCNGAKVILKDEEFVLNNIFNITESFDRYLKDYGHQSKYYRNRFGILTLKVNYVKDDRYQILPNKDLIFKLDLHFQYVINGYEFEYEHLDGKKYRIKIPPKTKDGDLLKIDGKGLIVNQSLKRSDLIFRVNVIIDYNLVELAKNE
jgi:molecular chaperone DnaJ